MLAVRYKPDGTLDPTFNGGASIPLDEGMGVSDIAFDSEGNAIIIGGGNEGDVAADGDGLVSRAGTALLAQVSDAVGLSRALSVRLRVLKQQNVEEIAPEPGK